MEEKELMKMIKYKTSERSYRGQGRPLGIQKTLVEPALSILINLIQEQRPVPCPKRALCLGEVSQLTL